MMPLYYVPVLFNVKYVHNLPNITINLAIFIFYVIYLIEFKCIHSPPQQPNVIHRPALLNKIKLLQTTSDPHNCQTALTIADSGGFGKTVIATSLCHHPRVKDEFTHGFVFIELGPQVPDPSIKLSQLYHLLAGEYLKHGDTNHAEQEINQLTSVYYHNLLVIIDDV